MRKAKIKRVITLAVPVKVWGDNELAVRRVMASLKKELFMSYAHFSTEGNASAETGRVRELAS